MLKKRRILVFFFLVAIMAMSTANILAETMDETQGDLANTATVELPTNAPAEPEPTKPPAEEKPTEAPAEEKPTEAPVEEKPTEAPAEEKPTEAPAEEKPTEAPAEVEPTEVPAEAEPTEAAATVEPTEAPATAESTEAAATAEPTEAPAEEAAPPDRSVTIRVNGEPGSFRIGDTVVLEAVLKGYEGVQYEIAWEHSLDGVAWNPASGVSDHLTYTFIMDEETATWYWRVLVEPIEVIKEAPIPLSDGSRGNNRTNFITGCAAAAVLLLLGWGVVVRRRRGRRASS